MVRCHDYRGTVPVSELQHVFSLMYVEDRHVVAEALATTCAVNTNLKRVSMSRLPPLPVMKSLTNRKAPLDELVVKKRRYWVSFMILHPFSVHMTPGCCSKCSVLQTHMTPGWCSSNPHDPWLVFQV